MNIEKVVVDKEKNIVQITTLGERWYEMNGVFAPSVTWICGSYPKGIGFYKWLANKGWDESEEIKELAGASGSKVHAAIEDLVHGREVTMQTLYENNNTNQREPLSVAEWEAVISFYNWFSDLEARVIDSEFVIWNQGPLYAGTVDLLLEVEGEVWLIDIKTSASVWPSHEIQVSAYKHALDQQGKKIDKIIILQVGYNKNKAGFKVNEINDQYDLFLATLKIWENENKNITVRQKDYPFALKLEKGVIPKNG